MISMWIRVVRVAMIVIMRVVVAMRMIVGVVMVMVMPIIFRQCLNTALATVKSITVTLARAIFWRDGANAFHMMMMAFLRQANLIFKAKHLRPILTKRAVHGVFTGINLLKTLCESFKHLRVVV